LYGTVNRSLRRHYNDGHGLGVGVQLLQKFQAAHARHLHVGDYYRRSPGCNFFQSFGAILSGVGPIAPARNQFGQAGPLVFFILDD
jgi:hypothetical protein